MSLRCIGLLIRSHESQLSRVVLMMWWCGFNFSQDVDQCQFKIEWSSMGVIWLLKKSFASISLMFRCPSSIPRITCPHHRVVAKDMQPLRSTSSLHLTRVQAKESSSQSWKARSWRFGSRYVRPSRLAGQRLERRDKNKERWETDMENRWK